MITTRDILTVSNRYFYLIKSKYDLRRDVLTAEEMDEVIATEMIPSVTTKVYETVGLGYVTGLGGISIVGFIDVDQYGIKYRVSGVRDWTTVSTTASLSVNNFTKSLIGLTQNTTYEYVAFIKIDDVEYYGSILTFKTLQIPQANIDTKSASSVTSSSFYTGGENINVWEDVDEYGVEYREQGAGTWSQIATGTTLYANQFNQQITGLSLFTTYEYRAYMVIGASTVYGETKLQSILPA